ncbi:MAG: hypothetical protein VYC34_11790 [Planctomycetota bacterium]|nr:hypothetical protein [Planctomycetota bacterium]
MTFVGKLRLRLFVFIIGVPLAAVGAIALSPSWAALPVVGVAFYALSVGLNKTSQRLTQIKCWTCGKDLRDLPAGEHGVACPDCGTLNQPFHLALVPSDDNDLDLDDEDDNQATA